MTRSKDDFDTVVGLISQGHGDCEIARLTGVPRETVRDWRRGKGDRTSRLPRGSSGCDVVHDFSILPPPEYSYLLGMYLGDGYIARDRRVWRLRISSDSNYPGIIEECCRAMEEVMPGQHAHVLSRDSRCVEISMYSKHWPCLLPQHGSGRKHERAICLEPWQENLIAKATKSFVRGLVHSDGCRVVANDRGIRSVRYHFSNRSEDIKGLFCAALDGLGIEWTRPSDRDIAIYRKSSVKLLDEFIGPKQ